MGKEKKEFRILVKVVFRIIVCYSFIIIIIHLSVCSFNILEYLKCPFKNIYENEKELLSSIELKYI